MAGGYRWRDPRGFGGGGARGGAALAPGRRNRIHARYGAAASVEGASLTQLEEIRSAREPIDPPLARPIDEPELVHAFEPEAGPAPGQDMRPDVEPDVEVEIDPRIASMFHLPPLTIQRPVGLHADLAGSDEPIELVEDASPEDALADRAAFERAAPAGTEGGDVIESTERQLAAVDQLVASQLAEVETTREENAGLAQSQAGQLRSKVQTDAQLARHDLDARKNAGPPVTREELAARVTSGCEKCRGELEATRDSKKQELDGKLAAREAELTAEGDEQARRLEGELAQRQAALEKDIEARKSAHARQIEQEKPKLEREAALESQKVRDEAAEQAGSARETARLESERVAKAADQKAEAVRAKGDTEAAEALRTGESKATEARDAAEARAAQLEADEASAVRAEGENRARMATREAAARSESIKADARKSADELVETGKTDAAKLVADGEAKGTEAEKRGEEAAAQIQSKLEQSIAAMQAESDKAVAAMEKEVADLVATGEAEKHALVETTRREREELKATIEAERIAAIEAIEKEHARALAAIDEREKADLAAIDAAGEKELARLEREIERDLAKLDADVEAAERRIDAAVAAADRKVAADVARRQQAIRAEGARATAAIQRKAAEARKNIAKADQGVAAAIHATAERGAAEIEAEAERLSRENAERSTADLVALDDAGREAVLDIEGKGDAAIRASEEDRKELDDDITQAWVDDAKAKAEDKLDDIFVTDGEATEAMNIINSLPPEAQGQVVTQMSDEAFAAMLEEVPNRRREEFASMVVNCNVPDRKLALFDEQHRSYVVNEAERRGEGETEEQKARRKEIAETTLAEMDDEMRVMKEKAGREGISVKDVNELVERKLRENQIENDRRINITNDVGKDAGGEGVRRVWSKEELDTLDQVLDRLPPEHVEGVKAYMRHGSPSDPSHLATFDPRDEKLRFFDGAMAKDDPFGVIAHEIAHSVSHDARKEKGSVVEDYKKQFDSRQHGDRAALKKQLVDQGMSEADADAAIDHLDTERNKPYTDKDGLVIGNRRYVSDGNGGYKSYDIDAMPMEDETTPITDPAWPDWEDDWEYGRSANEEEVFADHYRIAAKEPERCYDDFITGPRDKVAELRAAGASPEEIAAAEAHAAALEKQYKRLREGVFGVDDAAVQRAAASVPPDRREEFIRQANGDDRTAARAMTPAQLEDLRKEFGGA